MKSVSPNSVPFTGRASFTLILVAVFKFISSNLAAQTNKIDTYPHYRGEKQLFINIYRLEPGSVIYEEVARAHTKNLASRINIILSNFSFLFSHVNKVPRFYRGLFLNPLHR